MCQKKIDKHKVEVKYEGGNAERTIQFSDATLKKIIMKNKTTTVQTISPYRCKFKMDFLYIR